MLNLPISCYLQLCFFQMLTKSIIKKRRRRKIYQISHSFSLQPFWFLSFAGVILPGMTLQFPFTFKSSHCGIYSEQWLFETHPVLQGGAPIILTLRGTIIPEDKFCEERKELRVSLHHFLVFIRGGREPKRHGGTLSIYKLSLGTFSFN